MSSLSYKQAGVDIAAGNALVETLKPLAKATTRSGSMGSLGGFGGMFDLKATGYQDPLLVAATDGVGTKLKLALDSGLYDDLGQDLVAMCVNDLVVQGAEPLFFLDYFATGHLDQAQATSVIGGIARACQKVGCALLGGETAEMPGLYQNNDFDLAGFTVGAVERDKVLTGNTCQAGDIILGLASDGIHANGFSLVRKLIDQEGAALDRPAPYDSTQATLAQDLLRPTRLYVKSCLPLAQQGQIKGLAHITGGGLTENLPRVLPDSVAAHIEASRWPLPPVFDWVRRSGDISASDMLTTFNCGIGMAVIVSAEAATAVSDALRQAGETVHQIGHLQERASGAAAITFAQTEALFPA